MLEIFFNLFHILYFFYGFGVPNPTICTMLIYPCCFASGDHLAAKSVLFALSDASVSSYVHTKTLLTKKSFNNVFPSSSARYLIVLLLERRPI